tara:strand:- start:603 stop:893 length:291 start_codon:yes stop_codon:yes gene_type:complete
MSECPQVKIMRLEERIKEQAAEIAALEALRDERFPFDRDTVIARLEAEIARLREAVQAVADAKKAWDACNDPTANELARDHMMGRVYALAKALEDS